MTANPKNIYREEAASDRLVSPFHMKIQPMERLLLVNIEKDPDREYVGFEPQVFDDDVQGTGLLVIAYRHDGCVDVYHEPQLHPEVLDYSVVGEGVGELVSTDFAQTRFEISNYGVDAHIEFHDKFDRPIHLQIEEANRRQTRPFSLLAPLGTDTTNPPVIPLFFLYEFYFVRRTDTKVKITIDGTAHEPDRLGFPIDGRRVYFMRYSADPLIARFNPNHDGPLQWWTPDEDSKIAGQGARFDIIEHDGRLEITAMNAKEGRHEIVIEFSPPIPDLAALRDGASTRGEFEIATDSSMGILTGRYRVQRRAEKVALTLHPSGGWKPRPDRFALRLIYTLARVFKNWPKTYEWKAEISFDEDDKVTMHSRWRRIEH